ncbi:MAG: chemotaxis protein CheD [Verrucomicrobiota bacterium]
MLRRSNSLILKSGELLVCREPHLVSTVLGSCVAITMHHPATSLAAICHAMLPAPSPAHGTSLSRADQFRYVTCSIPALLDPFHRAGIPNDEIDVKMFGGANVIALGGEESPEGIGAANIATARQILASLQLRIVASDVGGSRGRKLFFNTATGDVFHKYLAKSPRTTTRLHHARI